jgi:membrane protein
MELNVRRTWERAQRFFGARIWAAGVDEVRRSRALLYRAARILYATVRVIRETKLNIRAAALTYFTVLSVVPFLAFAFSALKGFGLYKRLVDDTIRPYLRTTFGENPSLLAGFEKVLEFVEKTDFSGLGALGVLFLAYTSISLLSTVESALNDVWDAKTSRPLLRQITDYTTLLVVTPLLMLTALTFSAAVQSSRFVSYLRNGLSLGPVIDFLIWLTSLVAICVALTAVYFLLPNVRVRLMSAVLGGVSAGLMWQGLLFLHVRAQMGVASYNAIYSGFAALPIFFVWLYFSWIIVLVGATLAASHQNEQGLRQAMRARQADQELREVLAIASSAEIARRFIDGTAPPTANELTDLLDAPAPTVQEVLTRLVSVGIVARVVCGQDLGHLPARDIDAVRLADVREAVRSSSESADLKAAVDSRLRDSLRELLRSEEDYFRQGAGSLTLRELAQHTSSPARPRPQPAHPDQIDAKQPTVPG